DTEIIVVSPVHRNAQYQRLASQLPDDTQQQVEVGPLRAAFEAAKDGLWRVHALLPRDLRRVRDPECGLEPEPISRPFALRLLFRVREQARPVEVPVPVRHGARAKLRAQEDERLPVVLESKGEVPEFSEW